MHKLNELAFINTSFLNLVNIIANICSILNSTGFPSTFNVTLTIPSSILIGTFKYFCYSLKLLSFACTKDVKLLIVLLKFCFSIL